MSSHQEYIERVVAEAPPLTSEQRDKLGAIFGAQRRTLADLPAPDEVTARRLLSLLDPKPEVVSQPLRIEVKP